MNKKKQLAKALKKEQQSLILNGHDSSEHNVCIEYLTTGYIPHKEDWYEQGYHLVDAILNDFETIYNDYING